MKSRTTIKQAVVIELPRNYTLLTRCVIRSGGEERKKKERKEKRRELGQCEHGLVCEQWAVSMKAT